MFVPSNLDPGVCIEVPEVPEGGEADGPVDAPASCQARVRPVMGLMERKRRRLAKSLARAAGALNSIREK